MTIAKPSTSQLARLVAAVDRRILPAIPADRPGLLRAANGAYSLWYLSKRIRMIKKVHRTDPRLFAPVGPVRLLRRPLPPRLADAIFYATEVSTVAFTLGARHRISGPLHAALMMWTLSYRNSWSMIYHSDNNLVLHTAVLGLTRSADGVSIDARSRRRASARVPEPSWRYAAPVRGIQLVTATTYFLAGLAKVTSPLGLRWASGESLRSQIAADGLRKELLGSEAAEIGMKLYPQVGLFRVLAAGSLVLEIAAPLALLDRRLSRLWAVSAFGMHWGIYLVMGIKFRHNQSGVLYLPYFPVHRMLPH